MCVATYFVVWPITVGVLLAPVFDWVPAVDLKLVRALAPVKVAPLDQLGSRDLAARLR